MGCHSEKNYLRCLWPLKPNRFEEIPNRFYTVQINLALTVNLFVHSKKCQIDLHFTLNRFDFSANRFDPASFFSNCADRFSN